MPAQRADALTARQRHVAVGAIIAAHLAGVWGLLQVGEVREAAREAMPMFFDLVVAPIAPPVPPAPMPMPAQPVRKRAAPLSKPLIAATPSPVPAVFMALAPVAEPPAPEPTSVTAPAPAVAAAPAPPASAPAPAPRTIPPSAVQYLVEPAPEYPRSSIRQHETGRVVVRVHISEAGLPSQVQVERSSGFARLDDSAIVAVSRARFRPPTVDGRPVSGWTLSPVDFSLEK